MNRWKWIWLSVVLVIIVLIGSIVIKHWNSLEALVDSFRYSQDEVVEKLSENKEQLQEYIDKKEDITVRDLTEEEAKALQSGELTEEEAVKILTGQITEEPSKSMTPEDEQSKPTDTKQDDKKPEQSKPTDTKQDDKKPEQSKPTDAKQDDKKPEQSKPTDTKQDDKKPEQSKPADTKQDDKKPEQSKPADTEKEEEKTTGTVVSESIAKLYIQKNKYLGKLDTIENKVNDEFYALLKAEHLDEAGIKTAKQQFLKTNLSTVAAWERECDGVVYGILDEIEAALKESNEDLGIVKKLEEAYLNEKRLKKSYFIKRYMD